MDIELHVANVVVVCVGAALLDKIEADMPESWVYTTNACEAIIVADKDDNPECFAKLAELLGIEIEDGTYYHLVD